MTNCKPIIFKNATITGFNSDNGLRVYFKFTNDKGVEIFRSAKQHPAFKVSPHIGKVQDITIREEISEDGTKVWKMRFPEATKTEIEAYDLAKKQLEYALTEEDNAYCDSF